MIEDLAILHTLRYQFYEVNDILNARPFVI